MKIPFWIEKKLNGILKPNLQTIVSLYIDSKRVKRFYGKSLNANFLQMLYGDLNNGNTSGNFASSIYGTINSSTLAKTTGGGGTSEYLTAGGGWNIQAPSATDSYGTLFGLGTTSPTPIDFALETAITEGVGVNQLNYNPQKSIQGVQVAANISNFILSRQATNNSAATVNVNEIVIQVAGATVKYVVYREQVSQPVLIGQVLTCNIEFKVVT